MFKRLAAAVTATIVVGAILATPAAAEVLQAPLPAMGVQFHATWSDYTEAERLAVLDKMAAAGVSWVRVDVGWPSLQPQSKDSYAQWYIDRFDSVVREARARGIRVLGTLWGTPGWANGGQARSVPPNDPADFAAVSRFMAEKFRSQVSAWEVWNEPNHKSFWSGTPATYAELLKAAYPAFKAGDPDAPVVFAGPAYNDDTWISQAYAAGAQGSFDIMSTHPYQGIADAPPETPDDGTKWTLTHVAAVHRLMKSHGDGDKPIWFTEFGWSSHGTTEGMSNWQRGVTPEQQGDYLVRTLKLLRSDFPYVTNVFWYNERNRDSSNIQLANYGLLNRDLTPKPAYHAMKDFLTASADVPSEPVPAEPVLEEPVLTDPVVEAPVAEEPVADGPVVEEPAADAPSDTLENDPSPVVPTELLVNGGFENGLDGWSAIKSTLTRLKPGRNGGYAAKIVRKGDAYGITSAQISLAAPADLTATGYIKGRRAGQPIKLIVKETVGGSLHNKEVLRTTIGTGWETFPELSYTASGLPGSTITVKLRSVGWKRDYFLADDISLTTTG